MARKAVTSVKASAIKVAGGEGEAGELILQFFVARPEIERLLALRVRELIVWLQEEL